MQFILSYSLAWPDRFFPLIFGVAEKRVWSGLQSLLILAPPTVVGSVNDGNVIFYCSIVTRTISTVLYKRVSLFVKVEVKSAASMNDCKVEKFARA